MVKIYKLTLQRYLYSSTKWKVLSINLNVDDLVGSKYEVSWSRLVDGEVTKSSVSKLYHSDAFDYYKNLVVHK